MRILLWYWGRRGGGAQYAACLAGALSRRPEARLALSLSDRCEGLEAFRGLDAPLDAVPVLAGDGDAAADARGPVGRALRAARSLPRVPALSRRLLQQARAFRADAVFSAMSHAWTPLTAPVLARAGVPVISAVHDARPHPGDPVLLWHWRLRRELGAACAAVAFSDPVATAVARLRPGLPVLRLPLGAHLLPAVDAEAASEPVPGEFVFFGRLRAYKGLDLLRDAFALLRARHPEARLRVVGEGDAESLAPGLRGSPGVVVESRWVADAEMAGLLRRAWAVVLPYREASQSGVLPLALSLGVPVVATPVGGLPEQLRRGGAVAASVDAAALAEAMSRLMPAGARAALSREAGAAGAALSDWDAQAGALLDELRRLGLGASS